MIAQHGAFWVFQFLFPCTLLTQTLMCSHSEVFKIGRGREREKLKQTWEHTHNHMHMHAHTHAHTHACTHAQTHTHTYTQN